MPPPRGRWGARRSVLVDRALRWKTSRVRVLLTGGTGFLGSHSVAALRAAGHQVRLLVRDPSRIGPALAPFGSPDVEHVLGNVTDAGSVDRALDGCDAVVHAASVYSFDPRAAERILKTNLDAVEIVLGSSARHGLDPIVHVSSMFALVPSPEPVLTPDQPPTGGRFAYTRSKAMQEVVARRLQDEGASVVIVQPGSAWGPHDPNFGESEQTVRNILTWRSPFIPRGGFSLVDVRDVTAAIARAVEPGRGPRRYLAGGRYVSVAEVVRELGSLTGRRLPRIGLPDLVLNAAGRVADPLQRAVPWRLPIPTGGIWLANLRVQTDDSRAEEELGFATRPVRETLADTVRSMVASGRLERRHAGTLAV